MPSEPYLGELEELTLLALLHLEGPGTGGDVRTKLADTAGRRVSPSTAYLTLMRLEEKGLCKSWKGEPDPVPGGKGRLRYEILPEGVVALRRSREIRSRMWDGFDTLAARVLERG